MITGVHDLAAIAGHASVLAAQPPPLPGFLAPVGKYVTEYGYWVILLFVMLEDFGVPVPGETVLIAGAVVAGNGQLNVVVVAIVGFVAAVFGDNIGFAIGRYGGRALALRWGRYVFLTEERLNKAERFFDGHGGKIITIARFVEGLRQANGIIAGISGMRWLRFVAFNALGAALWVGCWVSVGYFGGEHITTIYDYITRYSLYALIAVAVVALAWIALHLRRRARRRAAAGGPGETPNGPGETPNGPGETADRPGDTPDRPAETAGGPSQASGGLGEASGERASDPAQERGSEPGAVPAQGDVPSDSSRER